MPNYPADCPSSSEPLETASRQAPSRAMGLSQLQQFLTSATIRAVGQQRGIFLVVHAIRQAFIGPLGFRLSGPSSRARKESSTDHKVHGTAASLRRRLIHPG